MEEYQRLSERMAAETQRFGPDDRYWDQFVRDHKAYLLERSTLRQYSTEKLTKYRYRPTEFFVDNGGIVQATWIWMFINDMREVTDFTEARTQFYMLPWETIRELFELYKNSESHVVLEEDA